MNLISKIYHSREDRIAELHNETDRLAYDAKDKDRLNSTMDVMDEYTDNLLTALERYTDADGDDEVEYERRNVIENWALAQAALSKAAWVMRFDGNVAYERMMNALKTGAAADMRGL